MEDRIEFNGNIFKVITSDKDRVITSDIIKISKKGESEQIYTFNIPSDDVYNIHKKIISIVFKVLQKRINPISNDFREYDNFINENSNELELFIADSDKFQKICREFKHPSFYGCVLIKNRKLYSYICKNSAIKESEITSYIKQFLDYFVIGKKRIKYLNNIITKWKQIIQIYNDYYIYCIKLNNNDIFIAILDSSIPIGKMMNISNNNIQYLREQNII